MTEHQGAASERGVVTVLAEQAPEAVLHLKAAVRSGVPWHHALLEAVALWTLPQEVYRGRTYQYLIRGEALDWLLLAERLCAELDGFISNQEREALLFHGRLPEEVSQQVFRDLIGATKHRAYLNYWYGVIIEEALQLAVEEEVRKCHQARCYPDSEELVEEAFVQLYSKSRRELLAEFRQESRGPARQSPGSEEPAGLEFSLTEVKEFTYWLFKRRFYLWDPARVASDTRKGIRRLGQLEQSEGAEGGFVPETEGFSYKAPHPDDAAIDAVGWKPG
jgi:hypothetical protein